jgi:hypothetical protein
VEVAKAVFDGISLCCRPAASSLRRSVASILTARLSLSGKWPAGTAGNC